MQKNTFDQDNTLISSEVSPTVVTISYARKVGLPNYSNEEFGIFVQVPIPDQATPEETQALIDQGAAQAKATVLQQLGLVYGQIEDTGVVTEVRAETAPAEAPKAAPRKAAAPARKAGAPKKASGGGDDFVAALWADLKANPDDWWDNRATKTGRQPDYKRKADGKALWADSAPDGFWDEA